MRPIIDEALALHELACLYRRLDLQDEPPTYSRLEHAAWEDARDDFYAEVTAFRDELDTLFNSWKW